ncbi:MAG TPA: kelch repeat-containing protein, partial [Bdellovibrionota bacterium]|nr:kelch repeat-containing protein [Bdellovibrionota bacterium]
RFNNGAVLRDTNFTLKGNTEGELSISNGPAYDFGIRAKNTTTQKTFTLTNSGGSEVTNIRELAGNALLAPFTFHAGAFPGLGGTCSSTLAASANCTFIVDFVPSAAGVFNDVITLDYDNGLAAAQSTRAIQGTSQAGWNPGAATALAGRAFHSAVWTGSEMIIWGGQNAASSFSNGARYNPILNSWTALSNLAAPAARSRHTAVWAGNLPTPLMIVFGGIDETGTALNSGAMYDPNSDTWTPLPALGAPEARYGHTAIWDDVRKKMIVWGGANAEAVIASGLGYVFDPAAGANGSWSLINDGLGQTPSARYGHSASWTGAKMLVWGGCGAKNAGTSCQIGAETDTGGIFDPQTASWIATSVAGAPSARFQHASVWTGTEMLIWGGAIDPTGLEAGIVTTNSGGYYAPPAGIAGDTWTGTSIAAPPDARRLPLAFWNGTGAIFWGGMTDSGTGSILQNGNVWSAMSTVGAPTRTFGTAGIFTGTADRRMIVFGGSDGAAIYSNVIAIYSPE